MIRRRIETFSYLRPSLPTRRNPAKASERRRKPHTSAAHRSIAGLVKSFGPDQASDRREGRAVDCADTDRAVVRQPGQQTSSHGMWRNGSSATTARHAS
jgi:hypothetical protein